MLVTTHWHRRYQGGPGAHAVIEAHVREWCEQVLVEVVLASPVTRTHEVGALGDHNGPRPPAQTRQTTRGDAR